MLLGRACAADQALLRYQSGPGASNFLFGAPTGLELTMFSDVHIAELGIAPDCHPHLSTGPSQRSLEACRSSSQRSRPGACRPLALVFHTSNGTEVAPKPRCGKDRCRFQQ